MGKKLTLSIDEAVIEAAKSYVDKQGISLSSYVESLLKKTTNTSTDPSHSEEQSPKTPITDKLQKIIENGRLTPEEMKRQEEEYYERKPYMKEVIEYLEKKHLH